MPAIRIAVVCFAPVQYTAPLFVRLAQQPELDLTVVYYSRLGTDKSGRTFRGFDRPIFWDVDLLAGYDHKFLPTLFRPDHDRRWTMVSPGLITELRASRYDVAVVYGWEFPTDWLAHCVAWARHIPVLLYGDTDVRDLGNLRPRFVRRTAVGLLCRRATGALYCGTFNRDFYIRSGISPESLWFSPWSVDNERFATGDRAAFRARVGLDDDVTYFLFVGKFIPRKRPLDLVAAVARLQQRGLRAGLLFAGSGKLESEIADALRPLADAHMLGFVNQRQLPDLYAASDVLVVPSQKDPRATVINEGMASGLPVIASSGTGVWGPGDLLRHGREGLVFPRGDLLALESACERLIAPDVRNQMGTAARRRVEIWGYDTAVRGWCTAAQAAVAHDRIGAY